MRRLQRGPEAEEKVAQQRREEGTLKRCCDTTNKQCGQSNLGKLAAKILRRRLCENLFRLTCESLNIALIAECKKNQLQWVHKEQLWIRKETGLVECKCCARSSAREVPVATKSNNINSQQQTSLI